MKELLKQIEETEKEMHRAEEQADYWLAEENYDESRAAEYEQRGDVLYKKFFDLVEKAAGKIVSFTSGSIDKNTARTIISTKRQELRKILL